MDEVIGNQILVEMRKNNELLAEIRDTLAESLVDVKDAVKDGFGGISSVTEGWLKAIRDSIDHSAGRRQG